MMPSPSLPRGEMDEGQVVDVIKLFHQKIDSKAFDGLWIPTHFAMDAETDDAMCWLLLEYIHRFQGSRLNMLMQLPTDSALDGLASTVANRPSQNEVFRDPESRNASA